MSRRAITVEEYRRRQAKAMKERTLQDRYILPAARDLGWLAYHTYDSRRSEKGFPDLVLVNPAQARLIFAELKQERRYPTPSQRQWLEALERVAARTDVVDVEIWRPADWLSGDVEAKLKDPR